MPKISRPQQRVDGLSSLLSNAHAHRIAVGWLVSREAGLNHDTTGSPFGGQAMEKWATARNLPRMLKAFQTQAKVFYRIRSLCLQLHNHPSAQVCDGAEGWWQRILEEDILAEICKSVGPDVLPEMAAIKPPTTAISLWWMRKGVNPVNPVTRPATWALIEAVQSRVYKWRTEQPVPTEGSLLPAAALNGEMSLSKRKSLLKAITLSDNGYQKNSTIELWTDWQMMLNAWQSTAVEYKKLPKSRPLTSADPERYDVVAWHIHQHVMPDWWANLTRIHAGLMEMPENKPSVCKGSEVVKTFQEVEPQTPFSNQLPPSRINRTANKKGAVPNRQAGTTPEFVVNATARREKTCNA